MIDVALASCRALPEPDTDEAPLLAALSEAGLRAETWAWDDDSVDWAGTRLVLLRSTWNYYEDRKGFLGWARKVAEVSALHNPVDVISWNTHKRYLLELSAEGVPVVPTVAVPRGADVDLAELCEQEGWRDVVVKPAVGAASFGTYTSCAGEVDQARFEASVGARDTLVQPFVESVRTHGERSVVVIDGEITHSVRKEPRFGGDEESVSGPHPVAADERELVGRALAAVPFGAPLLYARVDIVRDSGGLPMISELELAEPSLFFTFSELALGRMVAGVEARLG